MFVTGGEGCENICFCLFFLADRLMLTRGIHVYIVHLVKGFATISVMYCSSCQRVRNNVCYVLFI